MSSAPPHFIVSCGYPFCMGKGLHTAEVTAAVNAEECDCYRAAVERCSASKTDGDKSADVIALEPNR